jgi:hypothetical protein
MSLAHARLGRQPTAITQNNFIFLNLFVTITLPLAFWPQAAYAHDPPEIQLTRLDFDASQAPKSCNAPDTFVRILGRWVPQDVLRNDAERRLIVLLRSTSTGGKRADVTLVDEQGVILAERHTPYARATECHKVLDETAFHAAKMLGAFEPPLPKAPVTCPACSRAPACPTCPLCPTCTHLRLVAPMPPSNPQLPRFFIGGGAFVGSGIFAKLGGGPQMLLGFVPSRHWSQLHLEFEGSWTSQSLTSSRAQSIPIVGSICWVRGDVRFCGGMATTFLFSNETTKPDFLHLIFSPNFRLGTELFNRGPFSLRADVFARFAFEQQSFGRTTQRIDEGAPFAAGMSVLGLWAVD